MKNADFFCAKYRSYMGTVLFFWLFEVNNTLAFLFSKSPGNPRHCKLRILFLIGKKLHLHWHITNKNVAYNLVQLAGP